MTHEKAKEIAEKIKAKGINSFNEGYNNDPAYRNAYLVGWLTSSLATILTHTSIKESDLSHVIDLS